MFCGGRHRTDQSRVDAFAGCEQPGFSESILVEVTAPWCPTCKRQRPIVDQIRKDRPNLVVYEVDFDTGKDALKQLRVQNQSTLVVFRGASEVGRSTGDTDARSIGALVAKAF